MELTITEIGVMKFKETRKTIFEYAIETIFPTICKKKSSYLVDHINEICTNDAPLIPNTYKTHASGYYDVNIALYKISTANTTAANNIKKPMYELATYKEYVHISCDLESIPENKQDIQQDNKQDNKQSSCVIH